MEKNKEKNPYATNSADRIEAINKPKSEPVSNKTASGTDLRCGRGK